MTTKRIAVVTGGNKGIGLEICRQLANNDFLVLLTARDEKRGSEAVHNIHASGLSNVVFHPLDVTNPTSIASLADHIKTQYGKLDVLVNNAGTLGVIFDEEALRNYNLEAIEDVGSRAGLMIKTMKQTYELAEGCVGTNYYAPKQVTKALVPLLQQSTSPRIVNVTSQSGLLKNVVHERATKILSDVDGLTEERVDEVVDGFLEDVKEDLPEKKGWAADISAYILSKAALNAYTRILAKQFTSFRVNAVCPGYVKTDMNVNTGMFTVEEGARGPVMLALLPDGGPSGRFFIQTKEEAF